jgi:hypothetical protein
LRGLKNIQEKIVKGVYPDQFKGSERNYTTAFEYALEYCAKHNARLYLLQNKRYPVEYIKVTHQIYFEGGGPTSVIESVGDNKSSSIISFENKDVGKITLRNFSIDGNRDEQTISGRNYTTDPIHALYFSNPNGYWGDPWYEDPYHIIEHIYISHAKGSGLYVPNITGEKFQGCFINHLVVKNVDGNGIDMRKGSDHHLINCDVAGCLGGYGYYFNGGNIKGTNLKSYYCDVGLYADEDAIGLNIAGFESQEEHSTGIYLKGCSSVTMTSVVSDSHGHNEVENQANGIGIVLDGCKDCTINGLKIINRNSLKGQITTGVKFLNNARNNEVNATLTMGDSEKISKPILTPVTAIPSTNKVTIDGVTYSSNLVQVDSSIVPTVPMSSASMVTIGSNVTIPGWSAASQTGVTGAFTFDATERCQKIAITASTAVAGAYISMVVPCLEGDVLDFWGLCKAFGDVTFSASITWLKGTARADINSSAGTELSSKCYDKALLTATAPASGDGSNPTSAARLVIMVKPKAIGNTGCLFVKALSLNHSRFPRKEDFLRTYPGDPTSNVLPLSAKEEMFDTTNGKWYKSTGLQTTNWALLN